MKFDEILVEHLGEFGKYQKRQYFMLCLPSVLCSLHVLVPVFTAFEPPFSCTENGASPQSASGEQISFPGSNSDACFVVNPNVSNGQNYSGEPQLCASYGFHPSELGNTIVTEFNLVCDRKILATTSSMIYMAGVLVGSFAAGMIADRIGRKKTLLLCLAMQGCFGVAAALSPEVFSYMAFRFVIGAASTGVYLISYVLELIVRRFCIRDVIGVELVGPSKRLLTGIVIMYFFSSGYFVCSGVAYWLRSWRSIQLAISVPTFLFVTYFWLIKESPRWLLSKGRNAEACEILSYAAKINGVALPANILNAVDSIKDTDTRRNVSVLHLFKSRALLVNSIILLFNWFAISMCYYGLSYNTKNLSGDIFVNLMLSGIVEFPAETAAFACARLGRRKPHVFCMLLSGLSCGCTVFLVYFLDDSNYDWIYIALSMGGKFGVTMGFAIIYFWSAEIYPTALRNSMLGICSAIARVGSILAPLIADVGDYVHGPAQEAVAPLIFATATILGGLLSILLPETGERGLPETMDDAQNSDEKEKDLSLTDVNNSSTSSLMKLTLRKQDKEDLGCTGVHYSTNKL